MKHLLTLITVLCIVTATQAQWNTTGNTATSANYLGTNNNSPLRIRTNNVQRMIVDSLGRVGIGIAFPTQLLTVQSSGSTPAASWITSGAPVFAGYGEGSAGNADFNLLMASSTGANARGVLGLKRSRGTLAAPTAVANNDQLGSLLVSGYDGANFQGSAAVDFFADGVPTAGNVPARISFVTGTNGVNRTERLRISSNGNINVNNNQLYVQRSNGAIGIGTTAPASSAIVDMSDTARGLLIPRVTEAQRNAIGRPATGLLVYQTNNQAGLYAYNGNWKLMTTTDDAANKALSNLTTTAINQHLVPDSNAVRNLGNVSTAWNGIYLKDGVYLNSDKILTDNNQFYSLSVGHAAGQYITNASGYNTAVGTYALSFDSTGSFNTALGYGTLTNNGSGSRNTAGGAAALGYHRKGDDNTAFGYLALSTDTGGIYNTAIGSTALNSNLNGSYNTALGYSSLYANTTGGRNTAIGTFALSSNITGSYNTALGYNSMSLATSSIHCVSLGYASLYNMVSGTDNIGIGRFSLYYVDSTGNNTAIGYGAGDNTYKPRQCTFLGNYATGGTNQLNATAVGANSTVTASNMVRVGNTSVTSIGGQVGWTTVSDGRFKRNVKEDVPGLAFIKTLRPVTYTLDVAAIDKALEAVGLPRRKEDQPVPTAEEIKAKEAKAAIKYTGFIAQEVEDAARKLNYDFSGVDGPKNDKDIYGLRYAEFVVPLVKAVQELSKENEQLKKEKSEEVTNLQKQIDELKAALLQMAAQKTPCTTSK